jgi:hypothetical protein
MSGEMADPVPENISGEKSVAYSHEIHHRVNWGYVALGVAAILVLGYVWANVDLGEDDEQRNTVA